MDNHQFTKERLRETVPSDLSARIQKTLMRKPLTVERVIAACEALSKSILEMSPDALGIQIAPQALSTAAEMLSASFLHTRITRELGEGEMSFTVNGNTVTQQCMPLGVLLHIAPGNSEAVAAFSVVEGLLTGNVNLLKLPRDGDVLSVMILETLINIDPLLAEYIHIFRMKSEDSKGLEALMRLADGISVWGSDAAVRGVRALAPPQARLIEWGHKMSFAYIASNVAQQWLSDSKDASIPQFLKESVHAAASFEAEIQEIADNIVSTNQLTCNSCQGIYIDTEDHVLLSAFAEKFLKCLENAEVRFGALASGIAAQKTLEHYTDDLARMMHINDEDSKPIAFYRSGSLRVSVLPTSKLELSLQYRNCWIKPLPATQIVDALYPYRGYLQTVALISDSASRQELIERLKVVGATRITRGKDMAVTYPGMPHDGDWSLKRYTKWLSTE